MADVQIYTTSYCAFCLRAKALLKKKGVAFTEIDVSNDDEKRDWLVATTRQRTVPQIFINQKSVGGCDDLYDLDRAGELDDLLRQPSTKSTSL